MFFSIVVVVHLFFSIILLCCFIFIKCLNENDFLRLSEMVLELIVLNILFHLFCLLLASAAISTDFTSLLFVDVNKFTSTQFLSGEKNLFIDNYVKSDCQRANNAVLWSQCGKHLFRSFSTWTQVRVSVCAFVHWKKWTREQTHHILCQRWEFKFKPFIVYINWV